MKKIKKRKYYRIFITVLVCFIFIFGLIFFGGGEDTSSAHIQVDMSIKSVLVCQGDTLWSIAKKYHSELNGKLEDYVEEIRSTNQLNSDFIHAGKYIIVPYIKNSTY